MRRRTLRCWRIVMEKRTPIFRQTANPAMTKIPAHLATMPWPVRISVSMTPGRSRQWLGAVAPARFRTVRPRSPRDRSACLGPSTRCERHWSRTRSRRGRSSWTAGPSHSRPHRTARASGGPFIAGATRARRARHPGLTRWQRRVGRLVQGPVLARRAAGPGGDARADRHGEGRRGRMHPFLRPCLPGLHAANQDVRAVPVLIRSGIFEGGRESCCVGRLYPSASSWLRPQRPPDARCASHPPRRAERPGAEPGAGERLGVGAVQRVLTGDDVADPGSRSKQAARQRE